MIYISQFRGDPAFNGKFKKARANQEPFDIRCFDCFNSHAVDSEDNI